MTGDSWHLYQDDLVNNNAFAVRKRESGRASVRARAVPSMRKNEIPYMVKVAKLDVKAAEGRNCESLTRC